MTYKTFELLIAFGSPDENIMPKWIKVVAVDKDAAFADICEVYADDCRLVTYKTHL